MTATSTISYIPFSGRFAVAAACLAAVVLCRAANGGDTTTTYREVGGEVVIEAEAWTAVDTNSWRIANAYRDASGDRYIVSGGTFESRDKVRYAIRFATADTFYVFLRTWSNDPGDNGCFLTLDGRVFDNPGGYDALYFHKNRRWDWRCRVQCGEGCHEQTPYFVIDTPGVHTLEIAVREVGATIDKIVVRTDDLTPVDSTMAAAAPTVSPAKSPGGVRVWWWIGILLVLVGASVLVVGAVVMRRRERKGKDVPGGDGGAGERATLPEPVGRAMAAVAARYADELSLADLAEHACVSPSYLGRLFREAVGKTVVEYVNDYRLEQAMKLMKETTLNVSEIHHRVGIHHSSYFARVFKEKTGRTPSEYMQETRAGK